MTETFRRRALAEMGLAPWVPRLALLKDESAETVSLATVPKRGGADLEVINPGSTARLPIGPLTALNLPDLLPLMQGCSACDRVDTRRLVALPRGSAKARLMVIEQAPGPEPLNGDRASTANVQRLFEQMLFSLGLSVLEVYISHMVRCDGELPSEDQIATCSAYLKREIELIEPRAILAFEPLAEKAVRQFGISCEVLTLPHPRTLLGNGGSKKAAWLKLLELKSLLAQGED